MISIHSLTDLFVEAADSLVDDFDLVDFLHNLTDRAAQVSGADSVGLRSPSVLHVRLMTAARDGGYSEHPLS